MSKRIWSSSILEWDKAGSELWNLLAKAGARAGSDGEGDADWMDFEDEEKQRRQPTIIVSHLIPDYSKAKALLFERAGINLGSFKRKPLKENISVFITDVKIK